MVPCNDRGGVVVRQRTGRRFLFVLRNDRDVVRVLLNVHVGVGVLHDVLTRGRDLALKLTEHFVVRQELIQVVHVDLVHVLHHLHAKSLGQILFLQIRRDLDYAAVCGPHVHQVTTFVVLQPELSPRQELAILQVLFVLDDLDVVGELVLVGVRLGLTVLHRIFHPHLHTLSLAQNPTPDGRFFLPRYPEPVAPGDVATVARSRPADSDVDCRSTVFGREPVAPQLYLSVPCCPRSPKPDYLALGLAPCSADCCGSAAGGSSETHTYTDSENPKESRLTSRFI
jgi:hypothetical protein